MMFLHLLFASSPRLWGVQGFTATTTTRNPRCAWDTKENDPAENVDRFKYNTGNSRLFRSKKDQMSWFDERESKEQKKGGHVVRFLGKGPNAIVRPGVVLIAPSHEYHHFLRQSAVFIHAVGLNEFGEQVTRGVIVDHPTAFTIGEMSPDSVYGILAGNILFRGGDQGNDSAMMLHSMGENNIGHGSMIGTSGVYEGGLQDALERFSFPGDNDDDDLDPNHFKFFFNFMEFTDNELQSMLAAEDSEGDAWISVEVPNDLILDSDLDRADAWRSIRNKLKQMTISP